jgi:hypothetical protein
MQRDERRGRPDFSPASRSWACRPQADSRQVTFRAKGSVRGQPLDRETAAMLWVVRHRRVYVPLITGT